MSEVLREYLVELGFKVDERSWGKFNKSVDGAGASVAVLGSAVGAAALALTAATVKMAGNLDSLYWASQRIGSSVGNIKAYTFAVGQMGGSSEEALGSLENLGRFLASNPGGEGFLGRMGIRTRGANGNLRDTVDLMNDLAKAFRAMPKYRAIQYAERLGVDYKTLTAMINGTGAYQAKYSGFAKMFGVDLDKAAKDSKDFSNNLRELRAVIELLFAAQAGPALAKFMEWSTKNAEDGSFQLLAKDIGEAADATSEFIGSLARMIGVINGFSIKSMAGDIEKLTFLMRMATAVSEGRWGDASYWAGRFQNGPIVTVGKLSESPAARGAAGIAGAAAGATSVVSANSKKAQTEAIVKAFVRMGWTPPQAQGIAANLFTESSYNPNAVGDGGKSFGVGQWNNSRRRALEAFAKARGKPVNDLDTQLAFVDWELRRGDTPERRAGNNLAKANTPREAAEIVSRQYERPKHADFDAARRGALADAYGRQKLGETTSSGAVTLNQKTDVHIQGGTNPSQTAREVVQSQYRVNSDLVRNMSGAAR